jgi:hypothetical protein
VNCRVLCFVVATELLTSLVLYALSPTDAVRVWYPSGWAYVGEHALVWVAVFAAVFWTIRRSFKSLRSNALIVLVGITAELIATVYVWFVIPSSGGVSRAWYTDRFTDYFKTRITIWCVLATLAAILYLILHFSRWRFEQRPSSGPKLTG